ncbi:MAG TPA: efflux RND transporter periplasmic adaptor subunit [Gemmatimonadetes bacterium]|nr:efflux RND transporter periplasmic adaptor subunit [Gemmatimonadota bacterium]
MKNLDTRRRGVSALVAALAVGGCGAAQADGIDGTDSNEFVRIINVEVSHVETEKFVEEIRLTAAAVANQDVMVSAEESGVIREIFVDKGAQVERGAPLAKIDDRVLTAQVEQARAVAELAAHTWERRKRLWEEDRIGSEINYLEARFGAEQSTAALKVLEERLARTTIRAPFSGVWDERHVEVGSMVGPGQSVGRLIDLDPIRVVGGVPERYVPDVWVGAEASLDFDIFDDERVTAPIHYVGSTVNPRNRTFPIEVMLPNPGGRIKPEMVANMTVTRREVEEAIVVPQDVLVRVEDGYVVFVTAERSEGTVAEVRRVVLGPARRNLVVVESGIEAGEQLIVVGHKSVADGDRVNIVGERQ